MKPTAEKTKKNMTALDITALVNDLKEKIVGLRVSNIFDINPKTYVFKFARNEKKECLIIESGVRFHTTAAKIEKSKIPSGFTMKFRKFLRAKKLEKITQIGCERVVDMQFGSDNAFHLLLEFYSQGNIILTDKDYVIMQLMRSHAFTETVKTALGEKYPFEYAAKLYLDKFDLSTEYITSCIQKQSEQTEAINPEPIPEPEEKTKKKGKTEKKPVHQTNTKKYKDILFQILPCLNPALTDHLLKTNNINPNAKCSIEDLEQLKKVSEFSLNFLENFSKNRHKGFLVLSANSPDEEKNDKKEEIKEEEKKPLKLEEEKKPSLAFVDFAPCLFKQNEDKRIKIYETFDQGLDAYFSSMEVKSERVEFEQKAWKKYENIKQDQEKRLETLKTEQEDFLMKASLIEKNVAEIEAIINIIKTMVNTGLSWDKITKMINESKKSGDMLANMIYQTEWEQNEVVVLLNDPEHEDLEADLTPVQINFTISAFQNAKLYYENKKKHFVKEKKTIEASQQALKMAEKNALQEINKNKDRTDVLNARKTYWFEKFYWFISSENYLVLSGRDGQQNELLVKKYLQKGDVYLHADYHGAASTIVKNPNKNEAIPQSTLEEAAIYAAARSKAWENKILPGTWWVYDYQVSKSAPSGEYLPTGSFMIRGTKNFINPPKLELGVGFLFKIDESCMEAHANDRRVKQIEGASERIVGEVKAIEEKEKINEEYTLVTMSELQPRVKVFEKNQKTVTGPKNEKNEKNTQNQSQKPNANAKGDNNNKTEKKSNEVKGEKEKKEEKNKNPNNPYDNLPRGKKSKLKKMKEKYEDQDEDERQIKMKLIGAQEIQLGKKEKVVEEEKTSENKSKNTKNKKDKKGSKKNKMEDFAAIAETKEKLEKTLEKPSKGKEGIKTVEEEKKTSEIITPTKEKEEEIQEEMKEKTQKTTERIKEEESKTQENQPENNNSKAEDPTEEIEIKEEGNEDEIEEALEKQRLKDDEEPVEKTNENILNLEKNEWNTLIGNPLAEDTFFYIVPVCAPITSIQNYKHKIKLVPGTLKKGKAAKTISNYFLAQKDLNPLERKLIKGLSDFDLINDLIGGVKLVGSGVQKIRDQEKKSKKDKKKE